MKSIPFNKPYITGQEIVNFSKVIQLGKFSGNGQFTKECQNFFQNKYGFQKVILTTSCTDALEMCAILANIEKGDEVIIPSYTFVSTALAFVREGAKIVFADSYHNNPNIDAKNIEQLITKRTKAIVVVHYAGVACDMDIIMEIANRHNLIVIEDAAQAIDSYYKGLPIGSIGHFACFSFHETKNIISGEGGLLVINDSSYNKRADIVWEKGTNRAAFFRGEINKYGWVDTGSSFLPSEIQAAFLWAQLCDIQYIQNCRIAAWKYYYDKLKPLSSEGFFQLPIIPSFASNNAHMFYVVCKNLQDRTDLIAYLKINGISAVFHYLSLHKSAFYLPKHDGRELIHSDHFTDCLLRLPLYTELRFEDIDYITSVIIDFFHNRPGR